MARIVCEIEVDGKRLKALFDTGSLRSYVRSEFRPPTTLKVSPLRVDIGGKRLTLEERCEMKAMIEGLEFDFTAYLIDEIGETEYGRLDAIIGALAMEEWWIKLDPRTRTLDLSALRRREFTEFGESVLIRGLIRGTPYLFPLLAGTGRLSSFRREQPELGILSPEFPVPSQQHAVRDYVNWTESLSR